MEGLRRHTAHSQQCYAQWELDARVEHVAKHTEFPCGADGSAPEIEVAMEPDSGDHSSADEREVLKEPTPHCIEKESHTNTLYSVNKTEDRTDPA
jgi:hypothetical protein